MKIVENLLPCFYHFLSLELFTSLGCEGRAHKWQCGFLRLHSDLLMYTTCAPSLVIYSICRFSSRFLGRSTLSVHLSFISRNYLYFHPQDTCVPLRFGVLSSCVCVCIEVVMRWRSEISLHQKNKFPSILDSHRINFSLFILALPHVAKHIGGWEVQRYAMQ